MAVGVGVAAGAGVIIGLMLARGVGLFPGLTGCLLAVATTGVGLMLAVGGSDVLALNQNKRQNTTDDSSSCLSTLDGVSKTHKKETVVVICV